LSGNYIIPLFGDYDIRELRGAEIDRTILDMERYTARNGSKAKIALSPLSKGTKSKLLYSIKLMYDRWIYLGLVRENPTASITKYSKEPERKRTALPRDALEQLFPTTHGALVQVWGSAMWAACMLILLDTGARPGEARALTWGDFYADDRFVPIRHGVESGTKAKIKGTKTDNTKPGYLQQRTVQELLI
jgi:integrase